MPRSLQLQRLMEHGKYGNPLDRLKELEQNAEIDSVHDVRINNLGEISEDLGTVTAGEFISPASASGSNDPSQADFIGVFQSGDGRVYGSNTYNWGTVKNGEIAVGANISGDLLSGNGSIVQNEAGLDIGPGKLFLGTDGVLGDGDNIFLTTTNFNNILSLSGSGGYSALSTGAPAGAIYCIAKDGSGNIWVGGSFTQIGGVSAWYIAKWNGTNWSKLPGHLNGAVRTIAVVGANVYFGGDFTQLEYNTDERSAYGSNVQLNYIGKSNGTTITAITAVGGTGASSTVRALAVSGTTLYAGGDFTTMLGTSATRVCSIDTTGPTASALSTGLDGTCYSLVYDTDLYAGGTFTGKVKRYNAGVWSTWGTSGPNNTVYALAKTGNDVYAVGAFTSPASYIGKTTSGGAWGAVGAGLAGTGYSVAIDGSNIIAGFDGGEYTQYWNGSAWTSMGTGVNGIVYAVYVDTTWILAGAYTTASGSTMYRISRFSTSTAPTEMSMLDMAEMVDDHAHYHPLVGQIGGTFSAGSSNNYTGLGRSGASTVKEDWELPLGAGTIKGLRAYLKDAQPGTGSLVCTVYKNGSATSLVLTIASGAGAGTKSETTTEVTWADGDRISFQWANNAATASASVRGLSIMFKPSGV